MALGEFYWFPSCQPMARHPCFHDRDGLVGWLDCGGCWLVPPNRESPSHPTRPEKETERRRRAGGRASDRKKINKNKNKIKIRVGIRNEGTETRGCMQMRCVCSQNPCMSFWIIAVTRFCASRYHISLPSIVMIITITATIVRTIIIVISPQNRVGVVGNHHGCIGSARRCERVSE